MLFRSGKVLTSLLLGKKHVRESAGGSPFGGGSFPNGRYVMAGGDPASVALVSEAFASIEPKAEEWIEKEFLKVEKLRAVTVTATEATNSWKLSRETESGEWKLADLKGDEKLDSAKTSGLNYLLTSANFHDVAPPDRKPEETGLDKPVMAKLETFDGFSYTVKIGKADAEGRSFAQFTTTADLPKERTPGKDEKPEDKEKLDKEFKEKAAKLQEKLKKEQFHDKWVYLFDKWSIDNLLKARREFLADKKDDSKKEEASPLGAPGALPTLDPK